MKNISSIIIFLCLCFSSEGQSIDYLTIRGSLTTLSCGPVDSQTVVQTRYKLEAFDTTQISLNIQQYYRDLGWCYYRLYLIIEDTTYIHMASDTYDKALSHNPNFPSVLWDKSFFNYFFFKDCQKGKYYMDRYKKTTPKKYWDKEQMKSFTQKCVK